MIAWGFEIYILNKIQTTLTYVIDPLAYMTEIFDPLRGCVSVLEIVFVGQCEVFVCPDFVEIFFFPWSRSSHVRKRGVKKNVDFSNTHPLDGGCCVTRPHPRLVFCLHKTIKRHFTVK